MKSTTFYTIIFLPVLYLLALGPSLFIAVKSGSTPYSTLHNFIFYPLSVIDIPILNDFTKWYVELYL